MSKILLDGVLCSRLYKPYLAQIRADVDFSPKSVLYVPQIMKIAIFEISRFCQHPNPDSQFSMLLNRLRPKMGRGFEIGVSRNPILLGKRPKQRKIDFSQNFALFGR